MPRLSLGGRGNEAAPVHHVSRQRGGLAADYFAHAAAGQDAADRRPDGLCRERFGSAVCRRSFLGWTEGRNVRIELLWGNADPDRIGTFAKELVDLRPDVILSHTTPVTSALARETRTIPIVFVNVADPIASGFAASLARPGGNITGLTIESPAQGGKWVELLKEIEPHTVRMALLFNPATAVPLQFFMPSIQAAASSLAIQISNTPVHAKDEIEGVIAAQARNPGGGLIVMPDPFNVENRVLIIALAARYGVPAIYPNRFFTESGGLITYGTDFVEQFRQVPEYINRILRGERSSSGSSRRARRRPSTWTCQTCSRRLSSLKRTATDFRIAAVDVEPTNCC